MHRISTLDTCQELFFVMQCILVHEDTACMSMTRGSLHVTSFRIKQHIFVAVHSSHHMTTAGTPETENVWNQVPEYHILKQQPSFQLFKLANCKAYESGDYANANANASASQCIPL